MTFKNFDSHDTCFSSFAIATNPNDDDLQHPIEVSNATMEDVNEDYAILIQRGNLG